MESQVEAFDLNAISAGSNITFGVDDSLSGVSNATIGMCILPAVELPILVLPFLEKPFCSHNCFAGPL